jgi:hypothetical protein
MKELRAKFNLYLTLKDDETNEQVIERLHAILNKIQEENKEFILSEMYDYEVQE